MTLLHLLKIPGCDAIPVQFDFYHCAHVHCAIKQQVWQDERGFHMLAHGHFDENGALPKTPFGGWFCTVEI